MTTLEDDESLERELFSRREQALAAAIPARVPSLEDVLRAAGAAGAPPPTPRSNVVPFAAAVTNDRARRPARRMMGAVLLVSACAAAMVAIGPQLRQLVVGAPEATIVPEPAPRSEGSSSALSSPARSPEPASAPSASLMPGATFSTRSSPVASSVYSDVCGGEPGESSDTCSMSCEAESTP